MILAPLLDADKVQRLEPFGDDTWDLLRVIQESFGIKFTADDLIAANTVGKLGECISKKLTGPPTDRCLGAVVFHRLRRAFVDLYLAPRAKIRPDTGLDELLPWPRRLGRWESLRRQSKLILPDLAYPGWLVGAVLLVSTAGAWTFVGWFRKIPRSELATVAGPATLAVWILNFVFLMRLARPIAQAFPHSCDSMRDLVKVAVAQNHAKLAHQLGPCSSRELFSALRQLIAVETGCNSENISEQTAFPQGLNIVECRDRGAVPYGTCSVISQLPRTHVLG